MGKHTANNKTHSVPAETAPSRPPRKKRKALIILLVILGLLFLLAAVAVWFFWNTSDIHGNMFSQTSSLPTPIPTTAPTPEPALKGSAPVIDADWIDDEGNAWNYREDLVTVLLMGIDYMADESNWYGDYIFNGGNADILALAVLDPTNNTLSLLNIPRDTMADILILDEEGNYVRMTQANLSTAHSYGDGGHLSCELTVDAVSRVLYGLPIQRYAAVSFDVLDDFSDLMGGVTLTLEKDCTELNPSYTAGSTITLEGEELRTFIVHRDTSKLNSAYERGQRHMMLLNVLYERCKEAFLKDITFPIQLYNRAADHITTNLTIPEITYLARKGFSTDFGSDWVYTIQGETIMGEKYAEFVPDEQWLQNYLAKSFCVPAE